MAYLLASMVSLILLVMLAGFIAQTLRVARSRITVALAGAAVHPAAAWQRRDRYRVTQPARFAPSPRAAAA